MKVQVNESRMLYVSGIAGTQNENDVTELEIEEFNSKTYYIQLKEGSEATDCEPYGYKIPVKVSGKNYFDYKYYYDNHSSWYEDYVHKIEYNLKPNTTYIASTNIPLSWYVTMNVAAVFLGNSDDVDFVSTSKNGVYLNNPKIITTNEDGILRIGIRYKQTYSEIIPTLEDFINGTYWLQIEEGTEATDVEPVTTNIYLDEPLRKIGDYADYIDFKNQKVVRNVKVVDDTGKLTIEKSYQGLATPTEKTIDLPIISTNEGTNIIEIDTNISPSNMEVEYYAKGV